MQCFTSLLAQVVKLFADSCVVYCIFLQNYTFQNEKQLVHAALHISL